MASRASRYRRAHNCREKFMRAYPPVRGKYRCVYCGRKIPADEMEVDHIVPVHGVQKHLILRFLIRDMKGVNDVRNLVPSCHRCNLRKAAKVSLFLYLRAKAGRHAGFWIFRRTVKILFFLLLLFLAAYFIRHSEYGQPVERIIARAAGIVKETVQNIASQYTGEIVS